MPSITDKILLGIYSYYFYHDPQERYSKKDILNELKSLLEFSVPQKIDRNDPLLKLLRMMLDLVEKNNDWKKVVEFRNMKVHRLEPLIDVYSVEKHHDWLYIKRINYKEARQTAENDASSGHGKSFKRFKKDQKEKEIQFYLNNALGKDNFYYKRIKPEKRATAYNEFQPKLRKCFRELLDCANYYFYALSNADVFANLN